LWIDPLGAVSFTLELFIYFTPSRPFVSKGGDRANAVTDPTAGTGSTKMPSSSDQASLRISSNFRVGKRA